MDLLANVLFIIENDILSSILLIIGSIVAAFLIHFILEKYISRLTKMTKTTLDDELLQSIKRPIFLFSIIIGIYISLLRINSLEPYHPLMFKAFLIFLIFSATYTIVRIFSTFISWHGRTLSSNDASNDNFMPIIQKIFSVFIYLLALVIVLDQMGVKVTALVASLGVASLAVALALQETLSNFFSGLYLIADKPFKKGDFIKLETGEEGYVDEVGWRSTKIKLLKNNMIILPNSKIAQSRITNYCNHEKEMSFVLQCGVAYGSDLDKVEKVTINVTKDVLRKTDGGIKNFEPFIRYHTFGDSNIQFSIILRINDYVSNYLVVHELIKTLTKEYAKQGIEISWPVRKVFMHKSH